MEHFLSLRRITKAFAGVRALSEVSLDIGVGQVYCLLGENGSGKSTLIKIIAGVYAPDDGEITLNGRNFSGLRPIEAIREGIEVIFQDFSLFPNMSVAENLALNALISEKRRLFDWRRVRAVAEDAMRKIGVSLDLDKPAGELSIAERQLVAIARSLLSDARLIIMDEPTTALTRKEVQALFAVIASLRARGISILFVSHKMDEVFEIADRIVILRNGEKVLDRPAAGADRAELVRYMIGRDIADERSIVSIPGPEAPVILRLEGLGLSKYYKDISFDLRAGEIVGITGLLGSGRTALALSLFGMLPPDSGKVFVGGEEVSLSSIGDALSRGIGYVPEDRLSEGLFLPQSIARNVAARVIDSFRGRLGFLDAEAMRKAESEWVARLNIKASSLDQPASSLSGGNQQRVVLAKWLASAPRILILNGPTVGVDVGSKAEIHDIIRDLARQGMGLIVISDDVPELLQVCHRMLLMKKGRVAESFDSGRIDEGRLNSILASA